MRGVSWTGPAQADLARIDEWHRPRDPDFADQLGLDALAEARRAAEGSGLGSLTELGLRKWKVGQTGYLLFYRETKDGVEILRMRHERENWTRS